MKGAITLRLHIMVLPFSEDNPQLQRAIAEARKVGYELNCATHRGTIISSSQRRFGRLIVLPPQSDVKSGSDRRYPELFGN
jgi:hypothetical protein